MLPTLSLVFNQISSLIVPHPSHEHHNALWPCRGRPGAMVQALWCVCVTIVQGRGRVVQALWRAGLARARARLSSKARRVLVRIRVLPRSVVRRVCATSQARYTPPPSLVASLRLCTTRRYLPSGQRTGRGPPLLVEQSSQRATSRSSANRLARCTDTS
jgi:hypothetical protein